MWLLTRTGSRNRLLLLRRNIGLTWVNPVIRMLA
jgi:hypothetical protein